MSGLWRAREARINEFPQFKTEIDGLAIHFMHVRSPEPSARPLVITHGWPGSFLEYLPVISALTDPQAHGGDAADAFSVVVPSLPGFGFSGPPPPDGLSADDVASLWDRLMTDGLGYPRYAAHGSDLGRASPTTSPSVTPSTSPGST